MNIWFLLPGNPSSSWIFLPNKLCPIFMSFSVCRKPTEIIYYCLHEHEYRNIKVMVITYAIKCFTFILLWYLMFVLWHLPKIIINISVPGLYGTYFADILSSYLSYFSLSLLSVFSNFFYSFFSFICYTLFF